MNAWLTNSQNERDLPSGHTFDNTSDPSDNPSIACSIDSFSDSMEPGDVHDTTVTPSEHNTTATPSEHENLTMTILIDIQKKCKDLNRKFDQLEKSVDDLKKRKQRATRTKPQAHGNCKFACCKCVGA
ncbi:hypothetical protein DPMN_044617 [Dreissena polymorpha]|uniref:Uncharacterized protein n=1 Tax=Dreissena polymorpha TaxID=45954 RepID=A0A9D4D4I2_DREPO|nr:hypothetical protein DPMN_044617 [Dreissena polymorpha]